MYIVYRTDRNSNGGDVALLIKQNIIHYPIKLTPTTTVDAVAVTANTTSGQIIFNSIYSPPNVVTSPTDLNKLFSIGQKVILLGDLNIPAGTVLPSIDLEEIYFSSLSAVT